MATYAIGDIQGCYQALQKLLTLIQFDPAQDHLWCTGDLINRGPDSLKVLRFIKELGQRAVVVLGNHEVHLLATYYQQSRYRHSKDTLDEILLAPDVQVLIEWLRYRPFLHHDPVLNYTLIHAGFPPQWTLLQARQYACEVEEALRGPQYLKYLSKVYGNEPNKWSDKLKEWDRLRFITNCFTRLRYCNAKGKLTLDKKGPPILPKADKVWSEKDDIPWFLVPNRASVSARIIFGHWAALGLHIRDGIFALDSGCLWGGELTALRLDDQHLFQVSCIEQCVIDEI